MLRELHMFFSVEAGQYSAAEEGAREAAREAMRPAPPPPPSRPYCLLPLRCPPLLLCSIFSDLCCRPPPASLRISGTVSKASSERQAVSSTMRSGRRKSKLLSRRRRMHRSALVPAFAFCRVVQRFSLKAVLRLLFIGARMCAGMCVCVCVCARACMCVPVPPTLQL